MSVSYNKLWKLMIDKKMKKGELKDLTGIGFSTISKLNRDEFVSLEVLVKISKVLDCDIGDIVERVNDK
jgi:putative transcriptional regulator